MAFAWSLAYINHANGEWTGFILNNLAIYLVNTPDKDSPDDKHLSDNLKDPKTNFH